MFGLTPTKNGSVTSPQSNAAARRPLRVPTAEELPPLVERTPLAVFDEALTFLRIQPGMLLGIAFMVLLPLRLIAAAMPGSALRDARPDQLADIFIGNLGQPGAIMAAVVTLILESIALMTVASIYGELIASWYSGRSMSATDLLLSSIKRSPKIVLVWVISKILIVGGGLLTGGLLGVLIGVFLIAVGPVMGAENASPMAALRRSMNLVSSRFGQATFVYALTGVGAIIMRFMIEFAPALILNQLRVPLWLSAGILDLVASVFAMAFVASASVVLYLDLRVRGEGIDLDMAIDQAYRAGRGAGARRG